MNYMTNLLTNNTKTIIPYFKKQVKEVSEVVDKNNITFTRDFVKIKEQLYFLNALPEIVPERDVLKKPKHLCKLFINWDNLSFSSLEERESKLTPQWGWLFSSVDKEHSRNNFKNKETAWVVFDSEEKAQLYLDTFNKLFLTAAENDAIVEYKHYKKNPLKRILTFNKLVDNVYSLYDLVDKGLI